MTHWSRIRLGEFRDMEAEGGLQWSLAGFRRKGELRWCSHQVKLGLLHHRESRLCVPVSFLPCHVTKLLSHSKLHYSFSKCSPLTLHFVLLQHCGSAEWGRVKHSWTLMVILGSKCNHTGIFCSLTCLVEDCCLNYYVRIKSWLPFVTRAKIIRIDAL